ncbi:MAG: hypothetical protein JRN59_00025 [Nitrososphaerota archaeon]|nr:hypothetical protein [Nitrososphaerota archaeon]
MRKRKDVNVYLFDPTRKYFHIMIELENVPGALKGVLTVMSGLGLNILGSFTSVDSAAKEGVWSGFVEDSDHTAQELRRRLVGSEAVRDVMVVESNKGFLVDSLHFPVAFNTGTRAVMMSAASLAGMLSAVNMRFGTGGNVILYEEGAAYGSEVGREYMQKLDADFVASNIGDVVMLYQALGWFRVDGVRVDQKDGSVVISAGESFECSGYKSRAPRSHFVRGHLAGALSELLGRPMACTETLCIAMGDKTCEFTLTPKAA